jgi:hypothetical protein
MREYFLFCECEKREIKYKKSNDEKEKKNVERDKHIKVTGEKKLKKIKIHGPL